MRGLHKISLIDKHIAIKIKKFRIEQGVGLEELAELVGVSFQQLQKYETAKNKVNAGTLFLIAHTLEKPISAFFEGVKVEGKFFKLKISSEKKRKKTSEELNKDLLPLIRSFNIIENRQLKRHIVNLVREISGPHYRKKVKHLYS